MPATTQDILTDENAVRSQIEAVQQERTVFREVFREADLSNANSDTVYFVVHEDDDKDIEAIPEGGEFPRDMSGKQKIPCHRNKYGEEYGITREAEMDGLFNDVQDEADSKMRRMARRMDNAAYEVLSSEMNPDTIGAADGALNYEDVVDANTHLLDDPYNFEPDTLFVGPQGLGDLLKDDVLVHPTEGGDQRIEEGEVGSIVGIADVYVSTTGTLGAGEGILVDSDSYGHEGVWEDTRTRSYTEEKTQTEEVMQFWNMMGWCSTKPNSAVKIEG